MLRGLQQLRAGGCGRPAKLLQVYRAGFCKLHAFSAEQGTLLHCAWPKADAPLGVDDAVPGHIWRAGMQGAAHPARTEAPLRIRVGVRRCGQLLRHAPVSGYAPGGHAAHQRVHRIIKFRRTRRCVHGSMLAVGQRAVKQSSCRQCAGGQRGVIICALLTNRDLAAIFTLIANLLEIKGEVVFKTLAYRKAAENLEQMGQEARALWSAGHLRELPGIGKALADKIDELLRTGRLRFLDELKQAVPVTLVELLQVPDVGPKKVRLFWEAAQVTTLAELEAAARGGKLSGLPGMGPKSEAKILAGLEALKRRPSKLLLGDALPLAGELLAMLRALPGVAAAAAGGSVRRMRALVGDVDLLVAAKDAAPVLAAFTNYGGVAHVLAQGGTKASVEFHTGMRAQLWVHAPERFGTALQYATGSKDHNVRLREIARTKNLSLSEHALTRANGKELLCASEEEVYAALGLAFIAPELREDQGEVQAAQNGSLPVLLERAQLRADLHAHSSWSDGKESVLELAQAAQARGIKILAITDHSRSLAIANGLSVERLRAQAAEVAAAQHKLGSSIRLLHGTELEINADGSLDFPDEVLVQLDVVVASLHMGLKQPRAEVTARLLGAINNPHVDIIGHPTGRRLPDREPADLDMEAVLGAAAATGTAMEINANPARLDLDGSHVRRALALGAYVAINTDAHKAQDLDLMPYGVGTARRGWCAAAQVINTWTEKELMKWLST